MVKIYNDKSMVDHASMAIVIKANFFSEGQISMDMMSDTNPKQFNFLHLSQHLGIKPTFIRHGVCKLVGPNGTVDLHFDEDALLVWTVSGRGIRIYMSQLSEIKCNVIQMVAISSLFQRGLFPPESTDNVVNYINQLQDKISHIITEGGQTDNPARKKTTKPVPAAHPVSPDSDISTLIVPLFQDGGLALYAASEQEYQELQFRLINMGYTIHYTIQPKAWDGLCKYVYASGETVQSSDLFEDTKADISLPAKMFLQATN